MRTPEVPPHLLFSDPVATTGATNERRSPPETAFYTRALRQGTPAGGFDEQALRDLIRPRFLPPTPRPAVLTTPSPFWLVCSDIHWPFADPRAVALVYEAVQRLRPVGVCLAGDGPDLLGLSAYPRDYRVEADLAEEQRQSLEFWHTLDGIGSGWGMRLIELEANHSGNGRESRFARWISDNANPGLRQMLRLPQIQQAFSYGNLFHPNDVNVELLDDMVLADDLLITHGAAARRGGGTSARAHADAWLSSVMHGHTHRVGSSFRRIPAVAGRPEGVIRSYEIGCLCDLNPIYGSRSLPADWAQGFAVVTLGEEPCDYGVELVSITRGRATVAALGQTLKA